MSHMIYDLHLQATAEPSMEYIDQIGFHVKRGAAMSSIPAYSTTSNMAMYLTNILRNIFHIGRKQYPIKFLLHPAHSTFYELSSL